MQPGMGDSFQLLLFFFFFVKYFYKHTSQVEAAHRQFLAAEYYELDNIFVSGRQVLCFKKNIKYFRKIKQKQLMPRFVPTVWTSTTIALIGMHYLAGGQ